MVREKVAGLMILALAFGAVGLGGGVSAAQASSSDAASPAGGSTGGIVIFAPAFGVAPATNAAQAGLLSPPIWAPRGGVIAPPLPMMPAVSAPGPALQGILLLQPAPASGSLVVPLRVPPISGAGPSTTKLQLVIPGPNPAQNTSVSLAQLLSTVLASMQPPGGPGGPGQGTSAQPLVSVFSTPSR